MAVKKSYNSENITILLLFYNVNNAIIKEIILSKIKFNEIKLKMVEIVNWKFLKHG